MLALTNIVTSIIMLASYKVVVYEGMGNDFNFT